MSVQTHKHTGTDSERLGRTSLNLGFFKTVTSVPTAAPIHFMDQIQIYDDGASNYILYVYDFTGGAWRPFDFSPNP